MPIHHHYAQLQLQTDFARLLPAPAAWPELAAERPELQLLGVEVEWGSLVSQWEVLDDRLWLQRLTWCPRGSRERTVTARLAVPSALPTWADWFSGCILVHDIIAQERIYSAWLLQRGRVIAHQWAQGPQPIQTRLTAAADELFGADEAAFLRGICEHPQRAVPVLVYADWLDDQADPRGPLVRQVGERIQAGQTWQPWNQQPWWASAQGTHALGSNSTLAADDGFQFWRACLGREVPRCAGPWLRPT
jgi:uncharacterized protein (TIGR02996 family)